MKRVLKLQDFKVGDRVVDRTGQPGTIVRVGTLFLYVHLDGMAEGSSLIRQDDQVEKVDPRGEDR